MTGAAALDPATAQSIAAGIRPYSPTSRREEVDLRIREYIASNHLQPGDRLPGESWFAAQLGVGRPLVRESLQGMEAVGVVETRKGVGRFVGKFEAESYLNHFTTDVLLRSFNERELEETRCLLEISAVTTAVERLTDDDLDQIKAHIAVLRDHAGRHVEHFESDIGMHRTIMSRADNRIIAALLDAVYSLAASRTRETPPTPGKVAQDLAEHEVIAEAALRRDGLATREALIAHFETTASRLGFEPLWRGLYGSPANESIRS